MSASASLLPPNRDNDPISLSGPAPTHQDGQAWDLCHVGAGPKPIIWLDAVHSVPEFGWTGDNSTGGFGITFGPDVTGGRTGKFYIDDIHVCPPAE
jgi:hypothetical protein